MVAFLFSVSRSTDLNYHLEGRDLAKHFGCRFIETSAKQRINVDEAFSNLVREIRKYNKVSYYLLFLCSFWVLILVCDTSGATNWSSCTDEWTWCSRFVQSSRRAGPGRCELLRQRRMCRRINTVAIFTLIRLHLLSPLTLSTLALSYVHVCIISWINCGYIISHTLLLCTYA